MGGRLFQSPLHMLQKIFFSVPNVVNYIWLLPDDQQLRGKKITFLLILFVVCLSNYALVND